MARRADIVDLLVPTRIMKVPPGLLDPKVANFAPDHSGPIFIGTRTVGQTVVAESEFSWHPWFQLGHQFRNVKDSLGQEPSIFGRAW